MYVLSKHIRENLRHWQSQVWMGAMRGALETLPNNLFAVITAALRQFHLKSYAHTNRHSVLHNKLATLYFKILLKFYNRCCKRDLLLHYRNNCVASIFKWLTSMFNLKDYPRFDICNKLHTSRKERHEVAYLFMTVICWLKCKNSAVQIMIKMYLNLNQNNGFVFVKAMKWDYVQKLKL